MSNRQYILLIAGSCLIVILLSIGLMQSSPKLQIEPSEFSTDMTIKQIAPKLGVTGKSLSREFNLPLDINKNIPINTLGVTKQKLKHVVEHLLDHNESFLKYYLFASIVLWGWIYLVKIGRPEHLTLDQKKKWFPRIGYIIPLLISVIVAGFLLGKSPNPMEGAVKIFKSMVGLYPDAGKKILAFIFYISLAVIGNKLICGWACPFGALQELIFSLPIFKKIKRHKLPFAVTNIIRGILFLVMLLLLFDVVGGKKGFVIYHYINPFNLFNLDFDAAPIFITVLASIIIAFFFYRPFCQFICPFGFISWIAERFSLYRVKIDHETCTQCRACEKACPLPAIEGRMGKNSFPADCFSCARCLNVCPVDAIKYGSVFKP